MCEARKKMLAARGLLEAEYLEKIKNSLDYIKSKNIDPLPFKKKEKQFLYKKTDEIFIEAKIALKNGGIEPVFFSDVAFPKFLRILKIHIDNLRKKAANEIFEKLDIEKVVLTTPLNELRYKLELMALDKTSNSEWTDYFSKRIDIFMKYHKQKIEDVGVKKPKPVRAKKDGLIRTFADLFPEDKANKYISILKKETWQGGLDMLVNENDCWIGKIEAGIVYLDELKEASIIAAPKSLAAKLMQEQFKGFKDPKKKIEPDDNSHRANDYRPHFKDEINRIKDS